jgi:hypothetical protein
MAQVGEGPQLLTRCILLNPLVDGQGLARHDGDSFANKLARHQLQLLFRPRRVAHPHNIGKLAVRLRGLRPADDFLSHIPDGNLIVLSACTRYQLPAPGTRDIDPLGLCPGEAS